MLNSTDFFAAERPQVFGICTTILTGHGEVFSGIPKLGKVTNLQYLKNDRLDLLHADRPT